MPDPLKRRVGLLGTSANPLHEAHLLNAKIAQTDLALDEVVISISPVSPQKVGQTLTPFHHRYRLAQLLLDEKRAEYPFVTLSRDEAVIAAAKYGSVSLDIPISLLNTLVTLRHIFPEDEVFTILGEDQWLKFHLWDDRFEIMRASVVGVIPFSQDADMRRARFAQNATYFEDPLKLIAGGWTELTACEVNYSSSSIRRAVRLGKMPEGITEKQMRYIQQHDLY